MSKKKSGAAKKATSRAAKGAGKRGAAKAKPKASGRKQADGFEFQAEGDETIVLEGKRKLGTIVTMVEASGRYCFRLGCDTREEPRTYRGRVRAAEALRAIDELKRQAKESKLSTDELIVRAWDAKPHTAPS